MAMTATAKPADAANGYRVSRRLLMQPSRHTPSVADPSTFGISAGIKVTHNDSTPKSERALGQA